MTPTISIIIPAAGFSRRMGEVNKLLMPVGTHETLLSATIEAALAIAVDDVVVVTGHDRHRIAEVADRYMVRIVHSLQYKQGMGATLKAGIASTHPAHALMIWPADMPFIQPNTVQRLMDESAPDAVVRPQFNDRPGHPVIFGLLLRGDLLSMPDEKGAHTVLANHREALRTFATDDPGVVQDFDTQDDFQKITTS